MAQESEQKRRKAAGRHGQQPPELSVSAEVIRRLVAKLKGEELKK